MAQCLSGVCQPDAIDLCQHLLAHLIPGALAMDASSPATAPQNRRRTLRACIYCRLARTKVYLIQSYHDVSLLYNLYMEKSNPAETCYDSVSIRRRIINQVSASHAQKGANHAVLTSLPKTHKIISKALKRGTRYLFLFHQSPSTPTPPW